MTTAILWLRNDLRLADNAALQAASRHTRVVAAFVLETDPAGGHPMGAASAWWLHHSLAELNLALGRRGSTLVLRRGISQKVLIDLARESGATHVYWNRRYEPALAAVDLETAENLGRAGLSVETFPGQLLFEPGEIRRADGGPLRVFSAFWKNCIKSGLASETSPAPAKLPRHPKVDSLRLEDLDLLPETPWYRGMEDSWTPGEDAALARVAAFADAAVADYADARDIPAREGTSRLSPHLHFGEISPRQILAGLASRRSLTQSSPGRDSYVRQLGWREFAHHLLAHYPHTISEPLNPRFSGFPWRTDYAEDLRLWQRGLTGIPLVDAGMRELWHTGWMHNRVRMVVASFLTKNLLIPWQEGARWFNDTLVDADLANNILGWQWVAGSGADAAPYFRIFNPVLQGEKFDPEGTYVKRWVPELAALPERYVHKPWAAPQKIHLEARIAEYPEPMVDLKETRERALAAYRRLAG